MDKVQAFEIKSSLKNKILKKNKENSSKTRNENYFMIFVSNGSCKSGSNNKREEVEQQINSLINEITTLIKDNRNTYENPSKLKEFEKRSSLRKRENQNNEPALAYVISSLNDRTIIYSYLSKYVVDMVEKLPNVMACTEDRKLYLSSKKGNKTNEMNKLNEILDETQWSGVTVRKNSDIHLS